MGTSKCMGKFWAYFLSFIMVFSSAMSYCGIDVSAGTTNVEIIDEENVTYGLGTGDGDDGEYSLVWEDNFEGSSLDTSKWNYETHEPGWVNNELQEYTDSTDNIYISDGALVIQAGKENRHGWDYYTSGKVTTQNKVDFK